MPHPQQWRCQFLSTLSLRRATALGRRRRHHPDDFYPRSPCGERHPGQPVRGLPGRISIHALLAESDAVLLHYALHGANFYPRSPCGERHRRQGKRPDELYFYPRSPCGERHRRQGKRPDELYFYPRSPCGERPPVDIHVYSSFVISIHALLAESDGRVFVFCLAVRVFLSTLSLRRATVSMLCQKLMLSISIHALLAESDFSVSF